MEPRHYYYPAEVTFTGEYFSTSIHVVLSQDAPEDGEDGLTSAAIKDKLIERAAETLYDYYGWDVESASREIDVELGTPY